VLKSGCQGCNESEKRNTRRVITHLQDKKPKLWKQIEQKFDPTGNDTKNFKKTLGI
jgi:Insect pheromone-binding family, A10/OS-D